jgi:hypothetical protein
MISKYLLRKNNISNVTDLPKAILYWGEQEILFPELSHFHNEINLPQFEYSYKTTVSLEKLIEILPVTFFRNRKAKQLLFQMYYLGHIMGMSQGIKLN